MSNALLVALDLETRRTVGSIYSDQGERLVTAAIRHEALVPVSGMAELPVRTIWDAAREVLQEVLATAVVNGGHIAALAVTSDPHTLLCLDHEDNPLQNAILREDQRASKSTDAVGERFSAQEFYRITGMHQRSQTALPAKLHWLSVNAPRVFARTRRFALPQDYVLGRLGGEAIVERSVAARTGLYDYREGTWWSELFSFLQLDPATWPAIAEAGSVIGRVSAAAATETGLPAGTPLVLGSSNQLALALAAGCVKPGDAVTSDWSGSVCLTLADHPVIDSQRRVLTGPYPAQLWQSMPLGHNPTELLSWYRETFAPRASFDTLVKLAQQAPPGCDGLMCVPEADNPDQTNGKDYALCGLTPHTERAQLVRAVVEADAFLLRSRLQLLRKLKAPTQVVRAMGESAGSDFWLQLRADVLQLPVERPQLFEGSSLGTAMCAAVGAEIHASIGQAARAMHTIAQRYDPAPTAVRRYDNHYARFTDRLQRLA